jgi:FkbM family methyltransferase
VLRFFVQHVPPQRKGGQVIRLVERFIPPPRRRLRTRHISGYVVTCDLSDGVQKAMFYRGTFEPTASNLIADALPVGGVFLDVGANAGHFTLLAAAKVGPTGRVHAIEAAPMTAHRLRGDLAANDLLGRVELYPVAVADQSGEMRLQHAPGSARHAERYLDPTAGDGAGDVVMVTTIDELIPDLRADVVKIDVEGADLRVLHGMTKTLATHPPRLMIVEAIDEHLTRFRDSRAAMLAFMTAAGFRARDIGDKNEAGTVVFTPTPRSLSG